MAGCCSQSEYRRFFNRKAAAKDARRFRRRGLTGTALTLTTLAGDVRGATVLACGDHLNDLGMFATADESIAPANAHTSVRAAATAVVASNDEDGVIRWLISRVGL